MLVDYLSPFPSFSLSNGNCNWLCLSVELETKKYNQGSRVLLFSYVELETKRILLDIFKEKQQKSAEAASIPSFYKKACGKFCFLFEFMFMVAF